MFAGDAARKRGWLGGLTGEGVAICLVAALGIWLAMHPVNLKTSQSGTVWSAGLFPAAITVRPRFRSVLAPALPT